MTEAVHHPGHYGGKDNPYEAIKVIEAWGAGFNVGNALKYICRAESKGQEANDYQKACWYLLRELAIREGVDPDHYNDVVKAMRPGTGKVVTVAGRPVEIVPLEDFKVQMVDGMTLPAGVDVYDTRELEGKLVKKKPYTCAYCGAKTSMAPYKDEHGQWPSCCSDCAAKTDDKGNAVWQPVSREDERVAGRCGRCLVPVPPTVFMHDCAGGRADHYVKSLEDQIDKLGRGLTRLGIEPEGTEDSVSAALRVAAAAVKARPYFSDAKDKFAEAGERFREARKQIERLYDTERSPGVGQTAHQARVERMMTGYGQTVPLKPTDRDKKTRELRARLILEESLETIRDGLRVDVSLVKTGYQDGLGRPDSCSHTVEFDALAFKAQDGPADLVELADGCADVSVVTIGTLSAFGIADKDLLEEVDCNNLLKIENGHTDEHGKFVKPEDHPPPDVAAVIRAQAEAGSKGAVGDYT